MRFRCANGRVGEFDIEEMETVKKEKAEAREVEFVNGR